MDPNALFEGLFGGHLPMTPNLKFTKNFLVYTTFSFPTICQIWVLKMLTNLVIN